MKKTYFIIYVNNLDKTKMFYQFLFDKEPIIDEPGMCEFELPDGSTLGIMPTSSLAKLFGNRFVEQRYRKSVPNIELYFLVDDAMHYHNRVLQLGATEIREFADTDWGDKAAYSINHDGHILAFAEKLKK